MKFKKEMDLGYAVSAHLAYWHAKDFKEAAEIIYDKNVSKPVVVNLAFACELYIKALLILQRKKQDVVSGHKLAELFSALDEDTKNRVLTDVSIKNWDIFMRDSSDAFEAWRYFYEKDKCMVGHIPELFNLANTLDAICEEIFTQKEN